jgi:hypothetical protein
MANAIAKVGATMEREKPKASITPKDLCKLANLCPSVDASRLPPSPNPVRIFANAGRSSRHQCHWLRAPVLSDSSAILAAPEDALPAYSVLHCAESIAVSDGVSRLTCLGHQTICSKLHVKPIGRRGLPFRKRGYAKGVCPAPAIKEIFVSKTCCRTGFKGKRFSEALAVSDDAAYFPADMV